MRMGGTYYRRHLLTSALLAFAAGLAAPRLRAQESDFNTTRKIAETQHDIVMVLIKKKEFTKAAEEADKIFIMKWPENKEGVLKDDLLNFSDLFRHEKQPEIALRLLDKHMGIFKVNKNRAEILQDKAYLLEGMGRHDEALDCFREARRLLETKDPASAKTKK